MLLPENSSSSYTHFNITLSAEDMITAMTLIGGFSYATYRIFLLPVRKENRGLLSPNVGPVTLVHCLKLLVVYCGIHSHTLQNSPYTLSWSHT